MERIGEDRCKEVRATPTMAKKWVKKLGGRLTELEAFAQKVRSSEMAPDGMLGRTIIIVNLLHDFYFVTFI